MSPAPDRWAYAPAAVLLAGAALVASIARRDFTPLVAPLTTLPVEFEGITGRDLPISAEEQAVAGMDNFVLRSYERDGRQLFSVYVGYYGLQAKGKSIHSPRNCLPGAGWEALSHQVQVVAVPGGAIRVNRYLLANRNARALVFYWYQGRGRVESNEYRVKWDLMRDAALYGRTEEALVRIVVPLTGTDAAEERAADAIAQHVSAQLAPSVDGVMPPLAGRRTFDGRNAS